MTPPPVFIIVAGPNGAGKSFYSSHKNDSLIRDFGIKSFDFDLAFSDLYEKFMSVMDYELENSLAERVKDVFEEEINHSLIIRSKFFISNKFRQTLYGQVAAKVSG